MNTNNLHGEPVSANGHLQSSHHHHEASAHVHPATTTAGKKAKQKKMPDPNEASKLIAAKISQLELDAAEGKDQEAEIGSYYPFQWDCYVEVVGAGGFYCTTSLGR